MSIAGFTGENFYLSNMYPLSVGITTPDGITVHTSEQLYLPARYVNQSARRVIQHSDSGYAAKRLSNELERSGATIRADWDDVKVEKMRLSVLAKFIANPDIAGKLIETGSEELIEDNKHRDDFWGVFNGVGENMLGKILMATRTALTDPEILAQNPNQIAAAVYQPHSYYVDLGSVPQL